MKIKEMIKDKEKQLKLLKYKKDDITEISSLLGTLSFNLMVQCYSHANNFHHHNKTTNKKYFRVEEKVNEQLINLLIIEREFLDNYFKPGKKTKADLYTYLYAYQMSDNFYDQYLYQALVKTLKDEFSEEFWTKHELNKHILDLPFHNYFPLLADTDNEINTGQVSFNFENPKEIINYYASKEKFQDSLSKLNLIRKLGETVNDYPCQEYSPFHLPYKTSLQELTDDIEISLEYEEPKQLIKESSKN